MSQSAKERYIRASRRRVAHAETTCHATVLRAFNRVLAVLNREKIELEIRCDREQRLNPQKPKVMQP